MRALDCFAMPKGRRDIENARNIREEGLLTEEELMRFSSEAREALEVIDRIRRA